VGGPSASRNLELAGATKTDTKMVDGPRRGGGGEKFGGVRSGNRGKKEGGKMSGGGGEKLGILGGKVKNCLSGQGSPKAPAEKG